MSKENQRFPMSVDAFHLKGLTRSGRREAAAAIESTAECSEGEEKLCQGHPIEVEFRSKLTYVGEEI